MRDVVLTCTMLGPVIIIPDTTPLIHLAAGGLLDLLPTIGRVIVPDVVAMEATRLPNKPWATEIATWLAGSGVEVVETELGGLYRLAIVQGLKPPRHAGEISIMVWLRDNLAASEERDAMIVFEDARVPRLLALEAFATYAVALTTRSFLEFAEHRGIIPSADAAFQAIQKRVSSVSPIVISTRHSSP